MESTSEFLFNSPLRPSQSLSASGMGTWRLARSPPARLRSQLVGGRAGGKVASRGILLPVSTF
eukprot:879710-Pyramimonas_sp.AAC.1